MTDRIGPPLTNGARKEGVWIAPIELVMAASASVFVKVIHNRYGRGEPPFPESQVFANGRRLFALVNFYGPNRPGLILPLQARLWENRDLAGGGWTAADSEATP